MSFYAQNTDVPVERSRAEIDRLLSKNGATTMGIVTNEEKAIAENGSFVPWREFITARRDPVSFARAESWRR